jgi:apolipoprotein N-acyltransferase
MYGTGFLVFLIVSVFCFRNFINKFRIGLFGAGLVSLVLLAWAFPFMAPPPREGSLKLAGVQMEFPPEHVIPEILNLALVKNPDALVFVMSEYTLDGGVPESLKNWCREHSRFLVVGGKDVVTNDVYYDTAFVIGTNGEIVFKQAKSVPIQFFKDGLPAKKQEVWSSPWGKIGICICYDLSYTRVTDGLIRQGAQLFIIPTMDVEDWGRHEHEIHSRVALVRAAEYQIPIFRVASSGISQAVSSRGKVVARTSIPGDGDIFSAQLQLPIRGSFPLDRFFAPFCVLTTGVIMAILLFLAWKDKHPEQKATAS